MRRSRSKAQRKADNAKWYKAHRDEQVAGAIAYYATHRDEIRARRAIYYAAHREEMKARNAAWRALRGPRSVADAAYYAAHRLQAKVSNTAWVKANPGAIKTRNDQRRARKAGADGRHTTSQWRAKLALHGHRCFYCRVGGKLAMDHDRPLVRGGNDNIGNLLPACKSCNSRKGTKTAAEFLKSTI